jgi:hypothetical protein
VKRNGQDFCTRCLAYYCDHAMQLDFEWTQEDEDAIQAIDLQDPDDGGDEAGSDPE